MSTYDKFTPTRAKVTHSCGYILTKVSTPVTHDITSLSDVPSDLWGTPWDKLPIQYHRFIGTGKFFLGWYDGYREVEKCPQCQDALPYKERVE
jgi:hypothetical protein